MLFDFEKKYFNFPNFKYTFIGHPLYHIKKSKQKNNHKYISLLFGSRENEINKLHKYFNLIENYIDSNKLNFKIFIPTVPHLKNIIINKTKNWKTEKIILDDIDKFDQYYSDVFISVTCSGTASLEIAKRNIPQIVIYKLNYTTEILLSFFVNIKNACILNIISKKEIIPEVVNSNLNKKSLIKTFEKLLNDKNFRESQINSINNCLPYIESNSSPYDISAKRILSLI